MNTNILFRGYILIHNEWLELSSDKLIFPKEAIGENPFEYIQNMMKSTGIDYYLVTYDEIES